MPSVNGFAELPATLISELGCHVELGRERERWGQRGREGEGEGGKEREADRGMAGLGQTGERERISSNQRIPKFYINI